MRSPSSIPAALASQPVVTHPSKPSSAVIADNEAQWLFTETELASTPSVVDGMAVETERELRTKGLNFILQVGIMLKIQQLTLYTAGVFFNRFLMRHSLQKTPENPKPLHHYQIAATALMLATKTDETIRRTKDIIIACCRVAQKNPNLIIDEQNKDYWKWRDTLLLNEDVLLEALCFDLTVESPYKILYDMLRALRVETNKVLRNSAWAFLCDSLMTTLCLLQSSRTIAAAALWCGARYSGTVLPGEGDPVPSDDGFGGHKEETKTVVPWWETLHVRLRDVKRACNYMAELYETSASAKSGTPNASGSEASQGNTTGRSQGHGMSHSQGSKDIYVGLRSEVSDDDEEDGEVLDDEGDEAEKRTSAVPKEPNGGQEVRGVKRSRSFDGAADDDR